MPTKAKRGAKQHKRSGQVAPVAMQNGGFLQYAMVPTFAKASHTLAHRNEPVHPGSEICAETLALNLLPTGPSEKRRGLEIF